MNTTSSARMRRLFVSDLDGTLVRSDGTVGQKDLDALKALEQLGIVRAIATGRSMHSLAKSHFSDLPVDYIVFSTGAGVLKIPENRIITTAPHLNAREIRLIVEILSTLELDFMIHDPIPDNHQFMYRRANAFNPDFDSRLRLYRGHCRSLEEADIFKSGYRAAQIVAIIPPERFRKDLIEQIRCEVKNLSVIRATSPLDGKSVWIEIFPSRVSKSQTIAWLADRLEITAENTLMVGNDYNDMDLLEWCGRGFVVGNAPAELKAKYSTVASNDHSGVNDAIQTWLASL